jgi:hypothetical protein
MDLSLRLNDITNKAEHIRHHEPVRKFRSFTEPIDLNTLLWNCGKGNEDINVFLQSLKCVVDEVLAVGHASLVEWNDEQLRTTCAKLFVDLAVELLSFGYDSTGRNYYRSATH